MLVSTERLYYEAESTGFRPEILEKVIYLIHLLNRFSEDPFYANGYIPTVKELIDRIKTGD